MKSAHFLAQIIKFLSEKIFQKSYFLPPPKPSINHEFNFERV